MKFSSKPCRFCNFCYDENVHDKNGKIWDDFDENDFTSKKNISRLHKNEYEAMSVSDLGLEEARLALLERTIASIEVIPLGPKSLKVSWQLSTGSPTNYVEGFRIHYRKRRLDRYEMFRTSTVSRGVMSMHTIENLEEHVEYEVFVQPYHRNVIGMKYFCDIIENEIFYVIKLKT